MAQALLALASAGMLCLNDASRGRRGFPLVGSGHPLGRHRAVATESNEGTDFCPLFFVAKWLDKDVSRLVIG